MNKRQAKKRRKRMVSQLGKYWLPAVQSQFSKYEDMFTKEARDRGIELIPATYLTSEQSDNLMKELKKLAETSEDCPITYKHFSYSKFIGDE